MQPEILRQRELLDQLLPIVEELGSLNSKIKDEEFRTDILISICQHRHTFEEQNVTDHADCVNFRAMGGSFAGVCGGLMCHSDDDPQFKEMIIQTFAYIVEKSLK